MKRVLLVHFPYEFRGGEDIYVESIASLYREMGAEVDFFPQERGFSPPKFLKSAKLLWSKHSEIPLERYDFVHLNNIFPEPGPAILRALAKSPVKSVMTVHNHRFYCTNGLALRNGKTCKICREKPSLLRPIMENCNHSLKKSVYHSAALFFIREQNLYREAIDVFIAPSPYVRDELIAWGAPPNQIALLPHFMESHLKLPSAPADLKGDVIYAGRLSEEKGTAQLLATVELLPHVRFTVAGSGPLTRDVRAASARNSNLGYVGQIEHEKLLALLTSHRVAVLPSVCNEILSYSALEAMTAGLRCVVPAKPSTEWLSREPFFGIVADTSDPKSIATGVKKALALPPPRTEDVSRLRDFLSRKTYGEQLRKIARQTGFDATT